MANKQAAPLIYSDSVEKISPDEEKTIQGIIETMTKQSQTVENREHHAVRASHAKSTALLTGTLKVHALDEKLAQGLFAEPGHHPVAIRFAEGPGETLRDRVATHRGMSIKIFDVEGEKLPGPEQHVKSQDFVFATGTTFPSGTASGFLKDGTMLQKVTGAPEVFKSTVSSIARQANKALGGNVPMLDFYGHNIAHPLTDAYFSQAPLRFGNYVAKLGAFPVGTEQEMEELKSIIPDTSIDPAAFRTVMQDWLRKHGIKFELRAQLWRDINSQPIEDASIEWPESTSSYETLGVIEIPPQEAHSAARCEYFDERLTFNVGNGLKAHRPLGSVMRARMQVYGQMQKWRQKENNVEKVIPTSIQDIPA